MNGSIGRLLVLAALAAAVLTPAGVLAQSRPQPQRVISRGFSTARAAQPATAPRMLNDRRLSGQIQSIKASTLLIRARNGREMRVDASDAIRSGMYSAPLFVGKAVMITGYYDSARTLHAQTITREARIDARTPLDR